MNDPIVVTRNLVKRGWTDFEPKVITGLITGSTAAYVVSILSQYGIHLTNMQQTYIAIACYFIGSYLTPSSGTTVTRTIENEAKKLLQQVEGHTGASVTTVTNSTPIQKPAPVAVPPASNYGGAFDKPAPVPADVFIPKVSAPSPAVNTGQDSVTQIIADTPHTDPEAAPTAVLSRGDAFFSALKAVPAPAPATETDGH